METIGVYVHIPFCLKKCGYCDFLSFPYNKEKMALYVEALIKEIKLYEKKKYQINSLFFGGGTPSLLSVEALESIMKALKEQFKFSKEAEITLESNPGTWTLEKAKGYKALGINRISMGVQSLNDDMLKVLGRQHDVSDVYSSMDMLKAAGFSNINLDLMFALPGQSVKHLENTMEKMLALEPTHISAYSLTYEPGTPFYERLEDQAEDQLDREMYHVVKEFLKSKGFHQYEISNFAKENYACQHNLVYWKRKPYLGLGLNAHGCMKASRIANVSDFDVYVKSLSNNEWPIESVTPLSKEDQIFEHIMLNLRLNDGLDIQEINSLYEIDFEDMYKKEIMALMHDALVERHHNHLVLTEKGMDLSNQVFLKFL